MMPDNTPAIIQPDLLLKAYAAGLFPMAQPGSNEIGWYSPDPRGILPLDSFRVTRSLRQTISKNAFAIQIDTKFEEVIRSCGNREETWISECIIASYRRLHELGHAHSVEAWKEGKLAGGLYGVSIGGVFFGESMFSVERDASKVALVALVERLRSRAFTLLDTQWLTPHLAQFGGVEIPRDDYLEQLAPALRQRCSFL